MDTKEISSIVGEEGLNYCNCISEIISSQDEWKYQIVPNEDFKKITDPLKAGKIYWEEILYRCHVTAIVSLFKSLRWIDAITEAKKDINLYSFASNLRGLIESIADSFYTSRYIPLTIAKNSYAIKMSLTMKASACITNKELENILIHFTHAAKLDRESKRNLPEYFNAKQTQEYLSAIGGQNDRIVYLYSFLCQISHPSVLSTMNMLFHPTGQMIVSNNIIEVESEIIKMIVEEYSNDLLLLFRLFCINCFEILKILNRFNLQEIKTIFRLEKQIDELDTWIEIEKQYNDSKNEYEKILRE